MLTHTPDQPPGRAKKLKNDFLSLNMCVPSHAKSEQDKETLFLSGQLEGSFQSDFQAVVMSLEVSKTLRNIRQVPTLCILFIKIMNSANIYRNT